MNNQQHLNFSELFSMYKTKWYAGAGNCFKQPVVSLVVFFVMGLMAVPNLVMAQTPQGSLTANGPFCGSGAGMLTWTATDGVAPFTVIYNDGISNRTATGVGSGTPFAVFTTPVINTTIYTLVSVKGTGGAIRTAGFTVGSASIVIKPKPVVTALPSTQTICSGAAISTIAFSSSVAGATIAWTRDNIAGVTGGGGLSGFSGTGDVSGSFTNTSATPKTVGIHATGTFDGCAGSPADATVIVNPLATLNTVASQIICNGASTTAINFSGNATSYSWSNDKTSIGLAASGTGNIASFTALNTGTAPVVATISVTPKYTVGSTTCDGAAKTFTITVKPSPKINSDLTQEVCSETEFTYVPTTSATGGTPTYTWSRASVPGISNAPATGVGNVIETLENTSPSVKTATYVYTVSAAGCTNPANYNLVVSVKPLPNASYTGSSKQRICSGSSITDVTIKSSNNVPGTNFSWQRSSGDLTTGKIIGMPASGTGSTISGELTNTTIFIDTSEFVVKATANGCASTDTFIVIVSAPITDNKILDAQVSEVSVCSLQKQVTIDSHAPTGGNGSPFKYAWEVSSPGDNAFAIITGETDSSLVYSTNNKSYFRRIAYSGVCSDTSESKLVNGIPNNSSFSGICTGGSGMDMVVVASYKGAVYTLQYDRTGSWINVPGQAAITGDGHSISFVNNKSLANYRVVVTVPGPGGCTEIVSGTATITAETIPGRPSATSVVPVAICAGSSANISAIVPGATPENAAGVYWYLTESGGLTLNLLSIPSGANFEVSPLTTTTYYAKSTYETTGCKSSTRTGVTVVVNPTPVMTSIDSAGICSGSEISIPLTSDLGAGVIFSWVAIDNPNTSGESTSAQTGSSIINTIINNTSVPQTVLYHVTPIATTGTCAGAVQTVQVTVKPTPLVQPLTAIACDAVDFTISPADGTGNIIPAEPVTTYTWLAPSGSGFTGGAAGTNETAITGNLTNTTGSPVSAVYGVVPAAGSCTGAAFEVNVTVNPIPSIENQTLAICSGSPFSMPGMYPFTGTNSIPAGTTYSWAPPTGTNISGIAAGTDEPNITGTVTNTTVPFTPVIATYTVTPALGVCEGTPFTIAVTLNSGIAANTAIWNGSVSSDWCNFFNWDCAIIPDDTKNTVIPSGTPHQPEITALCTANVRDLDVQGTANVSAGAGSILNIYGAVTNTDPSRYTLDGSVNFAGGDQDIPAFTFNGLGVSGGGNKTLAGPVLVNGNLDLNNGIIITSNTAMLTISETGTSGAGSDASHIEGPMTRLTNSTGVYTFPVGGNGVLRNAYVTPLANTASSYTVYYHQEAPAFAGILTPQLLAIQMNEYWDITRNAGSDASVGMDYKNPNGLAADAPSTDWSANVNPCEACEVGVVTSDAGNNWKFAGNGTGFPPGESTPWQSNASVNSKPVLGEFGHFTFGYAVPPILAVQLIAFNGSVAGNDALVEWKYGNGKEIAGTELQHSTNGNHFEKIAEMEGGKDACSYRHSKLQAGAHFYRLLIKDKAGSYSHSRTILLISGKNITVIKGLKPTLVNSLTFADIHAAIPQEVNVSIVDIAGRTISHQKGSLLAGDNNFRINTQVLMPGLYTVRLQTADGVWATFKLVKE